MSLKQLTAELEKLKDPQRAALAGRYFKTGPGQYGADDIFLGLTNPQVQAVVRQHRGLSFDELEQLLSSPIHEYRHAALIILIYQYQKAPPELKAAIAQFYLSHTAGINNWDLVDISAPKILGDYLLQKDKNILRQLAKSQNLWERRIAILSTLAFIKKGRYQETFQIAQILLHDQHDLIHKAVGWMLREVGKKDPKAEEDFLQKHYRQMPRTMLRYAIEKFPEEKRRFFLTKLP